MKKKSSVFLLALKFPCMRTDMLYGVQFSKDVDRKLNVLTGHLGNLLNLRIEGHRAHNFKNALREAMMQPEPVAKAILDQIKIVQTDVPELPSLVNFLQEDTCQHYYITQPVLQVSQKLKLPDAIDSSWLAPLPDGKRQLSFDNRLIRFTKDKEKVRVLFAASDPEKEVLKFSFFNIDIAKNKISSIDAAQTEQFQAFEAFAKQLFFQLVTFMEFSPIEEIIVAAGTKHGAKKADGNLMNTEKFPITIVNTNWNKTIRTEGFAVDGHLRMQPYGPGRASKKLIIIAPFQKKGYNLNAGKNKR